MLFAVEHLHDRRIQGDGWDRPGGRCEVHELARQVVVDRDQPGHHVVGRKSGPLECVQQTVAIGDELFDLRAGEFPATGKLGEHLLAVLACLVDHFAALLFGQFDLGLGIGCGVVAAAHGFEFRLFAQSGGV